MSSSKLERSLGTVMSTTRDLTIHVPTDDQRRARTNFWTYWSTSDTPVPPQIDLAVASRFGGNPAISRWWGLPGFQDWFLNREEFRQRMEFLAELCLDELQEIIRSKMSSPGDKLKAIQMVMSVSDKMPKSKASDTKYLDEKIANMNQQQLLEYIARGMAQAQLPPAVDVTPTKE